MTTEPSARERVQFTCGDRVTIKDERDVYGDGTVRNTEGNCTYVRWDSDDAINWSFTDDLILISQYAALTVLTPSTSAMEAATVERCAKVAEGWRTDDGSVWDRACVAIERDIRALTPDHIADAGEWERDRIRAEIINTPETADFMAGVPLEAAHQRERWSVDHDAGKTPFDWFWLIGYLAQKAASAQVAGNDEKALHHTISTAAALANWHAQIAGRTNMRPGIGPDNGGQKPGSAFDMASTLAAAPIAGQGEAA